MAGSDFFLVKKMEFWNTLVNIVIIMMTRMMMMMTRLMITITYKVDGDMRDDDTEIHLDWCQDIVGS